MVSQSGMVEGFRLQGEEASVFSAEIKYGYRGKIEGGQVSIEKAV